MEKIITVDLKGCKKAFANSVTQWDYGYKLHINGLSDFGGSVEVHFSFNEVGGEAERSIAEVTETGVIVEFPNWLLEREHNGNYYAYAFIYPATADAGQTIKTIVFPVMGRPKPADWTKKNDPDVIAQLNEKIEKKADKATTLSGYGIKDAYTKTEIDNLIGGAGYTKKEIDSFLSKKVDKVEGKDLSSNDFTDKLKAKLENAASKDDLEGAKTELNKNIAESEARANEKIENSAEELREYINEAAEAEAAERNKAIAETQKEAKNLYANVIKATANGEVIRVDDVSPAEHTARAKVNGKNLIPYPYRDNEIRKNGGTFIVENDGGVLASGTPTDYISLTVYNGVVLATKGLVTVSITGVFDNVVSDFVVKNEQGETIASVGLSLSTATRKTINLDDYPNAKTYTLILKRANNNKEMTGKVYPQIEIGDEATEYEPYIPPESITVTRYGVDENDNPQTYTPEADGTVNIDSVAPTMTLLTDTAGVNIELEYNQDSNKALGNVREDIKELDRVTSELPGYIDASIQTAILDSWEAAV